MKQIIENKYVYTTKDFDILDWHDCKIYGLAFDDNTFRFYLDIDFIIEWINPLNDVDGYKFKLAPATLIFQNVWNLVFDIDTNLSLDIDNISMQNPHFPINKDFLPEIKEYDWIISLQQGEITFKSIGLELYLRKSPQISQIQTFGIKERGGISFSTTIPDTPRL